MAAEAFHILHVAAENDQLPDAKVGGVADVVRDAVSALAGLGCRVTTVIPSHGFLHRLPGARLRTTIDFTFRGRPSTAELFDVPGKTSRDGIVHCVLHHPWMGSQDPGSGAHAIYRHDRPERPFATDGNRFACFCAATAAAAVRGVFGHLDVLHLHDWHAALVAFLRRFDPACDGLRSIRTVFSIHNLGLQGIRPLRNDPSSLEAWFPRMTYDWLSVSDPRWPDCVNLMATGIRLADVVHTVSPSYAREILRPSEPPHFHGAEGLERVLAHVHQQGRLVGILNGCAYPRDRRAPRLAPTDYAALLRREVVRWAGDQPVLSSRHFVAHDRLMEMTAGRFQPKTVFCVVSRLVNQKTLLLQAPVNGGKPALYAVLESMGEDGLMIVLGTGDPLSEAFFARAAAQKQNLIFLNGFSSAAAELLYANGDLFLMPSSYEPCGIGQMLAMRDGQPCIVHAVGGLRDTVEDGVTGFCFSGSTLTQQAQQLVRTVARAVDLKGGDPQAWQDMCRRAAAARFSWERTARQYLEMLYRPTGGDRDSEQP